MCKLRQIIRFARKMVVGESICIDRMRPSHEEQSLRYLLPKYIISTPETILEKKSYTFSGWLCLVCEENHYNKL